jgi:hypothetical protein
MRRSKGQGPEYPLVVQGKGANLGHRASVCLSAGWSCVPVSLRDHVLRSIVEGLADFASVTEHWNIATLPELDEPFTGLPVANQ